MPRPAATCSSVSSTYALRERRSEHLKAQAALSAHLAALGARSDLDEQVFGFHEGFHIASLPRLGRRSGPSGSTLLPLEGGGHRTRPRRDSGTRVESGVAVGEPAEAARREAEGSLRRPAEAGDRAAMCDLDG